jgi:hypothetical protein
VPRCEHAHSLFSRVATHHARWLDIEDDGSAEWQFAVDLIAMLSAVLDDQDVKSCLMTTLSTYLEGAFNVLANKMAVSDGRPIPNDEVTMRLAHDEAWRRAVELVRSL